ncbi:MAG: hypothetical protein L6R41_005789 [Letrouitia leprolyta]|nr:MAG: hypothetical protein L6R41_005789 [Letrouitia leprolyta]
MWPSGSYNTSILQAARDGNYTATSTPTPGLNDPISSVDSWLNPLEEEIYGSESYESLYGTFKTSFEDYTQLNTSIIAVDNWKVFFPNGRSYTPLTGIFGLGSTTNEGAKSELSLLQRLKGDGTIASTFCGLHMGSALFGQRGSMVLGGYEQNRVLGDIGTFDLVAITELGGPRGFLLDVILDVEVGISPFNLSSGISLWHALDDSSWIAAASGSVGGRTGSRLISFNPSVPYMYLPPGICETVAQYLPLAWNAGLGLYLWRTDEQSSRIISSPAFMAFVLADNQAKNITIKVPFLLLNLTLLPPIVDTPTQYFPCRPYIVNHWSQPGIYILGRAFLQAAFLGFEYEHNLTYIAQAPGPSMEQSIIKTYQPNETSITPNSIGSFASSWASSWTVLENDNLTNTTGSDNTAILKPAKPQSRSGAGLSGGVTAGIVIGSVAGALAVAATIFVIWRRKLKTQQNMKAEPAIMDIAPPLMVPSMDNNGQPSELCAWTEPSEVYGNAPPHELVGPDRVYEVSYEPSVHNSPRGRGT